MGPSIPVYEIAVPEYTVEQKPDGRAIGSKLDEVIEAHFPGQRIAIRGIGLIDHPDRTLDDLAATILESGTDKYDPQRAGVHDDYYHPIRIDLFALACIVSDILRSRHYEGDRCPSGSVMGEAIGDFYGGALYDRGYAVRLDVLLIYDLDQLEPVGMQRTPEGFVPAAPPPPEDCCAFAFKYPDRKQEALLGVIKILREQKQSVSQVEEG